MSIDAKISNEGTKTLRVLSTIRMGDGGRLSEPSELGLIEVKHSKTIRIDSGHQIVLAEVEG